MDEQQHPMMPFVPVLKALAEARLAREQWLAWWAANAAAVERAAPPGWYLGLKPRSLNQLPHDVLLQSQGGAGYILRQLGVTWEVSTRYADAWKAELEAFCREEKRREREKAKTFAPMIAAVTKEFPKFGAFLKRWAKDFVEAMEPPASDERIAALEREAGATLPGAYKRLLRCTSGLWVGRLDLRMHHLSVRSDGPTAGMLCFGEFSLEADGDQVLFDLATTQSGDDDPPVLYHAHAKPEVRQLAQTFTAWLESLPKSPAFRNSA